MSYDELCDQRYQRLTLSAAEYEHNLGLFESDRDKGVPHMV